MNTQNNQNIEPELQDEEIKQPSPAARLSDKLPIASARAQAMKASYRQAWLYFFLVVCLVIAWWVPARHFITRLLVFRPMDTGKHDAYEFVALAYTGISQAPDEVSPENFQAQVSALRKAGYNPITLRDLTSFYNDNEPLPKKAILITFDHSRKSSYFDARRVLQSIGWPAVMFLWTKPILDLDPSALRWPYVRTMLRDGAWEAGAQSFNGFDQVLADAEGEHRNFMTTPRWLPDEARFETSDMFRQRLLDDHQACRKMIAGELSQNPIAYAFPYGDFGQYDERAVFTRRLNLDLISQFYELGFIHGNAALNTRYSDPRRLNRLLVKPHWTAEDLLQHLSHAWPKTEGYFTSEVLTTPLAWSADWGEFSLQNETALLKANPQTTGAKIWLNGSDLYSDCNLRLQTSIKEGQLGFFFRASPDGEAYVYLVLNNRGEVWLRQKHPGIESFTLGSGRFSVPSDGLLHLNIYLRDRLFYATANGHPVFQENLTVRGSLRPGMIGCSVWHPTPGLAEAAITAWELTPTAPTLVTFDPTLSRDPKLSFWLNRNAFRYTYYAPPWLRVFARGMTEQFGWDSTLSAITAKIHRMRFCPEILMENLDGTDKELANKVTSSAAEIGAHGIVCNLTQMETEQPLTKIIQWLETLNRSAENQHLKLIIRLPPLWEKSSTLATLLQGMPNITIALESAHDLTSHLNGEQTEMISVAMANLAEINVGKTISYQLSEQNVATTNMPMDASVTLLRDSGNLAFHAGDFELAVEIWQQWAKLDPNNAEPLTLIGDAYLQQNEVDLAIDAYTSSLELNPGQIDLVMRNVRLMYTRAKRESEAQALLSLYDKLFPNTPEILLAQAEWLIHQKKSDEATAIIRNVLDRHPDDLNARGLIHRHLPSATERFDNIQRIMQIGSTPGIQPQMFQTITSWSLQLLPGSWPIMNYLESLAQDAPTSAQTATATSFLPREKIIKENFSKDNVSTNWTLFGDQTDLEAELPLLSAIPTSTEAFMRLSQSDTMLNGFIEAAFEDSHGVFWLYARRSENNMIRLGFGQTGQIYLQVWLNGKVIAENARPWIKPPGTVTARLEVRGNAASGYINGIPVFGAPLNIPAEVGLGWWGLAPWAQRFGAARVQLRKAAGGPLPAYIGIVDRHDPAWTDKDYLSALQPWTRSMTAIAPPWFTQEDDGTVESEYFGEYPELRILCKYYQIRLMPCVRGVATRSLKLQNLVDLALFEKLDGFTLLVHRIPDEDWIAQAEYVLLETHLSLLLARINEDNKIAEVREICPVHGLFPGGHRNRVLPLLPPDLITSVETLPEATMPNDSVRNGIIWFQPPGSE